MIVHGYCLQLTCIAMLMMLMEEKPELKAHFREFTPRSRITQLDYFLCLRYERKLNNFFSQVVAL
jgi:murein L,D-transpeptidase YafK